MDEQARQAAIAALDPAEAVRLVKQLVDIPSPEGEELECARFLYGYMREAGIEAHLQEVEEGRANVIGVVRGEGDGPTLMLNGHLDTSYTGDLWEDYAGLGVPGPNHRPGCPVGDRQGSECGEPDHTRRPADSSNQRLVHLPPC